MTRKVTPKSLVVGAIKRADFKNRKDVCRQAAIKERTFEYHISKGDFPLSELTRLDAVLHFTDEECIRLIRGV